MKVALIGMLVVGVAGSAMAQAVTEADLGRLDVAAAEVTRHAAVLKASDGALAFEVDRAVALLKQEIIYLRVRLRREGTVPRTEYIDLRDRLETLRVKAVGQKVTAHPVIGDDPVSGGWIVPVGTEMDVRLQTPLSSRTARVEQRFEATSGVDLKIKGVVVLPAGTVVRGFVGSVQPAGRVERRGSLTLAFDEIVLEKGPMRLRASVTQALDGKTSEDVSRTGTGAAIGAIIGGLLGGGKGLLVGVLVGGGGTIAATDGTDVDLPTGTLLRLRIDSPLEVR
ncbi:MAG: hypothetical protein EXQ49_05010 [Acidobacteria bacterium]|nr:hypothetical protein [Acidobacteriota bacterium]